MKIEIKDIIYINTGSSWLVLLTLFFVLFSSCNNDNVPRGGSDSDKTATVRLTFTASSQQTTRALSSNESTVNDITVLIFNSNGDVIGSNYQTFTTSPYSMTVTTRFANNCTIYAIANTGSSSYFSGVSTLTAFKAKYTTLTTASDLGAGSSVIMFGKSTGTVNITTAIQSIGSIPLTRLCTRLDFTIAPASGITITGYQLCHVPMNSYISDVNSQSYNPGGGNWGNFTAITGLTAASTTVNVSYYMYENLVGTKVGATSLATRISSNAPTDATYLLVYAKTSGWSSVYCIYLGGTGSTDYTNYSIPRNYNYSYTININGSGWTDTRVTYTTNAPADAVYYYSDGTWGSYNPTKTAIGVVFSTTTSSTDQAKGWTHGYVMALTNAQSTGGITWAPSAYQSTSEFGASNYVNTVALEESDMDGYSHCQTIKSKAGSSLSSSYYSPFYYALNYGTASVGGTQYAAPSGTSGWYLPSIGQWYTIMKKLGGVTTAVDNNDPARGYWTATGNASFTAAAAINTYLNPVNGGIIDCSSSAQRWFWTSSEFMASAACAAFFNTGGELGMDGTGKASTDATNRVRAVLAF